MNPGAWHQCGHNSQKIVLEELENGKGEGVILSPRDLPFGNAEKYSLSYRDLGAEVAYDPQFYIPSFTNSKLKTYPDVISRQNAAGRVPFSGAATAQLRDQLVEINSALQTTLVIAPGVICETATPDTIALNRQLFRGAKLAGDQLGVPTLATIMIGASAAASEASTTAILSALTAVEADGWYFGFEFPSEERLPATKALIKRCLAAILSLACTGKPVFHAYSEPMAVLSLSAGASLVGVGHCQILWHFHRSRWENRASPQQGGGDAPPRFFSRMLWGTLVYPDEINQLSTGLQASVLAHSPFSSQVGSGLPWRRWDAYKHCVSVVCDEVATMLTSGSAQSAAAHAETLLQTAIDTFNQVSTEGVTPRDGAAGYQPIWRAALAELLAENAEDYAFMSLLP